MSMMFGRVITPPNTIPQGTDNHYLEKHVAVDAQGFLQFSPETSGYDVAEGIFKVSNYVWDPSGLVWVRMTQPGSSGGGSTGGLTNTELRAAAVPVSGVFWQATQPVSGTFWQATQPVSGPVTDTQLRATPLPVSGSFYQATQPVSGTFWQATQPVSGPLTDTQLRATAVPISGTFWQATQPVSGTVTANAGTGTFAVSGTFWQATQPVSGTFWQATQPVSGPLTDTQLRASAVSTTDNHTTAALPLSVRLSDGTNFYNSSGGGGGNLATAAKGSTAAGNPTSEATDANTQSLHARITNASLAVTGTFYQATQPVSGTFYQATQPVSGTFWQATQPVSGPLTDTQLRASAVPVSGTFWQTTQPVSGTVTANIGTSGSLALEATLGTRLAEATFTGRINTQGQKTMAASTPVVISSDQSTLNVAMATPSVLFRGRANTFRTPGRAGTVGQKILSLHNATGSAVKVYVTRVTTDLAMTVVKAVTVAPPIIRLWKVTVLPTNGTALTKNKIGGTTTSSASVTVLGDTSADGTASATTLTATLPTGTIISQEFAARLITGAGYEMMDRSEFNLEFAIELQALEGVVVFIDYTAITQNVTSDMWVAGIEWYETT